MTLDGIAVRRLVCGGIDGPESIRVSRVVVSASSDFAIVLISRPGPHRPARLRGAVSARVPIRPVFHISETKQTYAPLLGKLSFFSLVSGAQPPAPAAPEPVRSNW